MEIRDAFFFIGLLLGACDVLHSAQAEDDDPFGLADFNAEVEIAAEKVTVLAAQAELVRPQLLSAEERNLLNNELLQTVHEGRKGVVARVQDLIARGADVTAQDELGWIPLHHAVFRKNIPEIVAVLIKANPGSVNYGTIYGSTPLHMVFWNVQKNEGIIKALLGAGADPDIPDNRGETSRQLITKYGFGHLLPERGVRTKPARAILHP